MKKKWIGMRVITFLFIASVFSLTGESFAAPKSKISIKAKARSEKSDDDGEEENETSSSYTERVFQSETEVVTLSLSIKNGGDQPVSGKLKWMFISEHSTGKSKPDDRYSPAEPVIATFSPGSKDITIEPLSTLEETIVSEPFFYEESTTTVESYTGSGSTTVTDRNKGDVYESFLVLFIVDGEIVAMNSKSSRYKKDEWIKKCR